MAATAKVPRLIGAKIKEVRLLTASECADTGVEHEHAFGVVLDNGIVLVPLRDPEGNGVGCMTGLFKGNSFYLEKDM